MTNPSLNLTSTYGSAANGVGARLLKKGVLRQLAQLRHGHLVIIVDGERLWRDNLRRSRHNLEALGYDQTFYRLWEFYLCYCEGGFLERSIGTAHLLLAKPGTRPQPFGLKA